MADTAVLPSPVGELTLSSDGEALTGLWIAGQKHFPSALRTTLLEAVPSPGREIFQQTREWLDAYFTNAPLPPMPPLSPRGTPFQEAVWSLLREVPYGETTTYGVLSAALRAEGISASPQAVGGAVGRNPILILIPCHRVLGADGSLTGYAAGLPVKRRLLEIEKKN